jgi:hypothetical protein
MTTRSDWRADALCADLVRRGLASQDWWFPEVGNTREASKALTICERCPVKEPCLIDGMKERFGIWGGMTEGRRRWIRWRRCRTCGERYLGRPKSLHCDNRRSR